MGGQENGKHVGQFKHIRAVQKIQFGPNLQGKTDQVCSRPIHRNLAGQKGVAGYIQCADLGKICSQEFFIQ